MLYRLVLKAKFRHSAESYEELEKEEHKAIATATQPITLTEPDECQNSPFTAGGDVPSG